ncbi:hypothetical protein PFAG_01657 [Plasmodium falciparum Santa Lucia]|uniref:Erythrocyte membrane protein 1 n=1 Tax=Plasmodium falciparum Santa Lucia TaxID=478859 RepID=W7FSI1_PLAFA|nr:hypothetical protein PFAG_01657 [Plasmodium falciparum Santa Lucia]
MVLPKRAPTATIDYTKVTNVKELLDLIGKYIQQKVHGEALEHSNSQLHGFLSKVIFSGGHKTNVFNKCDIDEQYETNVTDGHSHPCLSRKDVRFSYTEGAECDKSKIKGSNSKSEGACAPLRRLSLCDQKLEHIKPENIKDTHNLYIDVLLAAKYEGQMIAKKLQEYDPTNYKSRICTELARSFADIGDIIRGKDLYLGYNKKEKAQKEKLEQNLKFFFQNIDDKLDPEAKNYYAKEKDPDFLKLREDWWELNRQDIWKALTCNAPNDAKYFRKTVCAGGTTPTHEKCTCASGDVPTYFDYVPQYLRWFDEWSEDFCRKKKKKLENVQKQCRGKYGDDDTERYCSGNGYDCERTIYKKGKLVIGYQCTNCSVLCRIYEKWIDNQKEQFLKQKGKYEKEMQKYTNGESRGDGSGRRRRRRDAGSSGDSSNYDGYEKKFYEKLKGSEYGKVDAFLKLLNKENECKDINEEKEIIDFAKNLDGGKNENDEGTFYHSQYCKPCPGCGMKKTKNGNGWEQKSGGQCDDKKHYKIRDSAKSTDIDVLSFGDKLDEIKSKIDTFCKTQNGKSGKASSIGSGDCGGNSDSSLCEPWKCYESQYVQKVVQDDDEDYDEDYHKEVENGGGLCVLRKDQKKKEPSDPKSQKEPHEFQKTFNNFFNFWVAHMLKDSIHWKKKLQRCLQNGNRIKCENTKCNNDCECFKKWVDQKKKEWEKIKEHFKTQKDIPDGWTHDDVLDGVLEKGVLLESLQEAYGKPEDIKHIEALLKETGVLGGVVGGKDNTTIDKLLKHEEGIAEKCKQKQEECNRQQENTARSADPSPPVLSEEHDDDEDGDEEEEDEDHGPDDNGDEPGEEEEETEEVKEDQVDGSVTDPSVDVCATVKSALTIDNLTKACQQKYGLPQRHWGWKCVTPSGDNTTTSGGEKATSGDKGATCIPPRRRRLYIQKLHDWASGNTQAGGEATQARDKATQDLRDAFIESAAIETFFLWDRYKKEKEKEKEDKERKERENGLVTDTSSKPDELDKKLKKGEIPEEFKRQMFYTFGDYKDILFGDKELVEMLKASGDTKIKDISDKIDEILPKNGDTVPGQKSVDPRKTWWETNGEHIWKGMICALTYEDNGEKGKPPKHLEDVEKAFFGTPNGKPGLLPVTPGTYQSKYQYNSVKLDEHSGTEAKGQDDSQHGQTTSTLLSHFVQRPTYFRYLEEWGETFCRQRTRMLNDVKGNCRNSDLKGHEHCSGDGLNCNEEVPENEKIYEGFHCPSCANSCRWYKKWIEKKKEEFTEQKGAYAGQKGKCQTESNGAAPNNGGNGFCGKLEKDAAAFLQKLGPCSKTNNENKKDNEEDKLDFTNTEETFRPATNCKPCSLNELKCNSDVCGGNTKSKCDGKKPITKDDIKYSSEEVTLLVSDDSAAEFKDGLNECKGAGIFEGIRKDVWKCGKFCDVDVCTLKKNNNGEGKEHIIMKELLKRWLEYFFDDYNKFKHKISHCINKENGSICTSDCGKKCKCVGQWIEKKRGEWENINNNYIQKYKNVGNTLTNFLETLIPQTQVIKATGHKELGDFDSKVCNCTNSSETKDAKEEKKKDIVECLLDKLKKKTESCPDQASSENEVNCDKNPPSDEPDEEDLLLEEENEKTNKQPGFCPEPPETKEQTDGTCDAVDPDADEKPKEEEGGPAAETEPEPEPEPAPAGDQKEAPSPKVAPRPAPRSRRPRRTPELLDNPHVLTALMSSTIMWSVGIGFAAFTYFFLKKKTKSSVGNLFQILQIPKSDYDIPTLKSSNRYIPYASDRYKGKTYIYMEGDSGDEKYTFMSDTSDITSSESEYEELDINEIYPYQSPKYKTLIEVILEPSKRDIQSDDTPSNKFTDNEWNVLKNDFITNILQNEQNDIPNNNTIANIPLNTHLNTLYFDNPEEKPFITNIHDRNLYSGEEYSYNINFDVPVSTNINTTTNNNTDDTMCGKNDTYSGIDLINDSLNSDQHIDIYDEILKRKENELFGTNHTKQNTSTNSVAKNTNSDPILNQINLFHKWLDRHRNICEEWDKNKEDILNKLKEEWNKENNNNVDKTYNSHNKPSHNHVLNTDVSIQIDMNNPNTKNEFTNMDTSPDKSTIDTILDDLVKYNEPYYYDFYKDDIIYHDVDVEKSSMDDIYVDHNNVTSNNIDVPTKMHIEMNIVNNKKKIFEEEYPISDIWNI